MVGNGTGSEQQKISSVTHCTDCNIRLKISFKPAGNNFYLRMWCSNCDKEYRSRTLSFPDEEGCTLCEKAGRKSKKTIIIRRQGFKVDVRCFTCGHKAVIDLEFIGHKPEYKY